MSSKPSFNFTALAQLDPHGLSSDTYTVAIASALLWAPNSVTALHRLLGQSAARTLAGKAFSAADVKAAISELREKGLLHDEPGPGSAFQLVDALRAPLYRQLLQTHDGEQLVHLVCSLQYGEPTLGRTSYYWPIGSLSATIAYVRAKFYCGAAAADLTQIRNVIARSMDWNMVARHALLSAFDGASFARIESSWRSQLAFEAIATLCEHWEEAFDPVVEWVREQLVTDPESVNHSLREILAELALHRGDAVGVERALHGLEHGMPAAVRAAQLVVDGQWVTGQTAFEAALKQRKDELRSNKGLLPDTLAWFYPLALLAQQTPRHLELARKFCLAESGRRQPGPDEPWGRWVHAIDVRLGSAAVVAASFRPPARLSDVLPLHALWSLLLISWLGSDLIAANDPGRPAKEWRSLIEALRAQLERCRMAPLRKILDGAQAVMEGRQPPTGFFVGAAGERWRDVLATLQSLGQAPAGDGDGESAASRLLWALEVGRQGQLLAINPLEQKRGLRGWNRPRATSLAKIVGNEKLSTWDAKVARAVRSVRGYSGRYRLDLAAAIVALVGHPGLVLAHAPEVPIELSEATPELELVRQKDHFVIHIAPPLRTPDDSTDYAPATTDERRELEALRQITLVLDGPQRLRLVRFSATQRQAAQLVAGRFAIPASAPGAAAELEKTLQALSSHFQVHADSAQASRQVVSDSRLRAELSQIGRAHV